MHKAKERLAKMERRHLIAACVVVVVLAAAVIAITVVLVANTQKQTPPISADFSVSGQMVCLPHKDTSGPQTLECAYGLRADDDRNYALQLGTYPASEVRVGQRAHVKGALTTGADSYGSGRYNIVGTIKVESLTKP